MFQRDGQIEQVPRWEVIARERQLCTKACLAVILSNILPMSENKTNNVLILQGSVYIVLKINLQYICKC